MYFTPMGIVILVLVVLVLAGLVWWNIWGKRRFE